MARIDRAQPRDTDLDQIANLPTTGFGRGLLTLSNRRAARAAIRSADARALTSASQRAKFAKTAATPELTPTITVSNLPTLTGPEYKAISGGVVDTTMPMEYRGAVMTPGGLGNAFACPKEPRREGQRKPKTGFAWTLPILVYGKAFEWTISGGGSQFSYRIWDGDKVSEYRTESSGEKTHKIEFAQRGWHRVEIDVDYGIFLKALIAEKTGIILPTPDRAALRGAVQWDSLGLGSHCHNPTGGVPTSSAQGMVPGIMKLLGVTDYQNLSMAGTGFLNKNLAEGGTYVGTYWERREDVVEAEPDFLILGQSVNDTARAQSEPAVLRAEVEKLLLYYREQLPEMRIYLVTPTPTSTESWEANAPNATCGREAVAATGAAKLIDAYAAKLFTGSGQVGAANGTGTADDFRNPWDNTHPSLAGHQADARLIATPIAADLGLVTGTPEVTAAVPVDLSAIEAKLATAESKLAVAEAKLPRLTMLGEDLVVPSNDTTLRAIEAFALTVAAGEKLKLEFDLHIEGSNLTEDVEINLTGPAGSVARWGGDMGGSTGAVGGFMVTGTGGTTFQPARLINSPMSIASFNGVNSGKFEATVIVGEAGVVNLWIAQDNADAGTLKLLKGSVREALRAS